MSYNQLGVTAPKRTFLDGRPSTNGLDAAYGGVPSAAGTTYPPAPPSPSAMSRPQTSGPTALRGGGGGNIMFGSPNAAGGGAMGAAVGGGNNGGGPNNNNTINSSNKMVVSPVPPSHAALSAQGGGPKTTEAVLLVEHKVELTDILHESLSLLDNVYRSKQIFGEHLRYVDPSFSGDAVQRMNLLTPPAFDHAYQNSIGSNVPRTSMAGGGGAGGGMMPTTMMGGGVRLSTQGDGMMMGGGPKLSATPTHEGAGGGGSSVNPAAASDPTNAASNTNGVANTQQQGATAANNNTNATATNNNNNSATNAGTNAEAAEREKALRQRLRSAEVLIKKLFSRTSQLDTEVAFFKDELMRMQTICGLSRSPASALSVTDGHIPLNHPLYAPRMRRRCRSAPPTRTLLRTAIGGYGLKFPFPTAPSNGVGSINATTTGGNGDGYGDDGYGGGANDYHLSAANGATTSAANNGAGSSAAGSSRYAPISHNPFAKKKQRGGGGNNPRRQSGPFSNGSEDDEDADDSDNDGDNNNSDGGSGDAIAQLLNNAGGPSAFAVAATDVANAAVQNMRRRITQLTEAVVMLQMENSNLRADKANRLSYRDALLTEYLVTRDRALAQLRASLQDAVTKVNNPMRLLRARQPNPGTNPAVATNSILQEVYQRLATEINALVGDIVSGGSAAVTNTNNVLLSNGGHHHGGAAGGGAAGGTAGGGIVVGGGVGGARDPTEADYNNYHGDDGKLGGVSTSNAMMTTGGMGGGGGGGGLLGDLRPIGTASGQRAGSRSTIPGIEIGRPSTSRPGTSGGDGADHMLLQLPSPPSATAAGGSRRMSGGASAGINGDDAYAYENAIASVANAGGNSYLLTCHGCGSCVPIAATPHSGVQIIGGGGSLAGIAAISNTTTNNLRPTSSDARRVGELQAMLGNDTLPSAAVAAAASAAGVGAIGPINCSLTQSASRRRELLTRLKPIVDALPLQRKKQFLLVMCEIRHLFDCLVLSHRTLLSRYDDDRKESHRQMVQLQVQRSLLTDQIGELEQKLGAITAAAQLQELTMQAALAAIRANANANVAGVVNNGVGRF